MARIPTRSRTAHSAAALIALIGFIVAACGTHQADEAQRQKPELEIYDAKRTIGGVRLTLRDVVRSSARAQPGETAMSGLLYLRFKRAGIRKFQSLTRSLAERGKRNHRLQSFAVEIDHHVYARPVVDYRVFPMGLDASQGLQISDLEMSVALRLAREIRLQR
jgi:hypothetical protein